MKKPLVYLLLVISLCFFSQGIFFAFTTHSFDHNAVLSNIEYLSSDLFKGRLAGSLENTEATLYIKKQFSDIGLKPYISGYFDDFNTYYPERIGGNPYLRIINENGQLVKEYSYGTDYKEDMLNFKETSFAFNKADISNFNLPYIQLKENGGNVLLYTPNDNDINFRSSFIYDSSISLCVFLSKATLTDIKNNLKEGYKVTCSLPYKVSSTKISNVIGYIPGKDTAAPPLIFSAHFDHLGTDLAGKVYNGALDNASGVAFLLELSKYISTLGTPDRSIIFIGFNAEELGCLGSKDFVDKYKSKLKGSMVFNFDMIGSNNATTISIMGGKKDTVNTPLIKTLSTVCENQHIGFKDIFQDASDHEFFRKANISAVTLCDDDMSRIHTLKDKSQYIDTGAIDRCFSIISREIVKYGYSNNVYILNSKIIVFVSFYGIIVFSVVIFKYRKHH